MKVVIIDDEQAMHLILKRMLAKFGDVEVVGSFTETATAYHFLQEHEVDLVFVDISMPREDGMEFAQRLRMNDGDTKLVFITSHKDYALNAFDVYAFDYILKPVGQERLRSTVDRALQDRRSARCAVAFNCLGGIDIRNAQGVRVKWKSSKSAELFGYLLLHKGRLVSRSRLIDDMFRDLPQKNAETYLNTTVYQLRKALDTVGLKENLQSDSNHYGLSLDGARVDATRFEEGCVKLAVIEETTIKKALELEQSYAGHLFGDRAFDWAANEAERLSLIYTAFTRRLCVALLSAGDTNTAIRLLMKLLTRDELDEPSVMLLLKAYALQKNREAMTRQFTRFMETMLAELGIEPSLEAYALYARLLSELEA